MKLSISVKSTIHKFFSCNCCLSITSIHEWHVKFSQSGIFKKKKKSLCYLWSFKPFPCTNLQGKFAFAPLDSMYSLLYVFNNITLLTLPLSLCLHVCLSVCLSVFLSLILSSTGSTGQKETPPTKTGLCSRFHSIFISSPPLPPPQCTLWLL